VEELVFLTTRHEKDKSLCSQVNSIPLNSVMFFLLVLVFLLLPQLILFHQSMSVFTLYVPVCLTGNGESD